MINILVLMAGLGSRFAVTGVLVPKPLIEVMPGEVMGRYVVDWLRPSEPHRFTFVCLADHVRRFDFSPVFDGVDRAHVVVAPELTGGPAATALLAAEHVSNDDELVVAYCDGFLASSIDAFLAHNRRAGAAGGVFTYPSTSEGESYAEVDALGRVLRTAEKQVISPHATAGTYYFRTGREFVAATSRMLTAQAGWGVEQFICPVMNEIIADGGLVTSYPIARHERMEMGTPEDIANVRALLADERQQVRRNG